MRFAFYASNNAGTLIKILKMLDSEQKTLLRDIEFVLIDNSENIILRRLCLALKIKIKEVDLDKKPKKNRNLIISNIFLKLLTENRVDYAFIFCDKLLRGKILTVYENKIINFHPSILPSFKGFKAIDRALEENAFLLGNSAHFVVEKPDSGSVIMQSILHKRDYKNYESVLGMQVKMTIQLMLWMKEKRLSVNDGIPFIKNASYAINSFIPNLEVS